MYLLRFALPFSTKKVPGKGYFPQTPQNACNSYAMSAIAVLFFPNIGQIFA
jgi:hypothetical protein